MNFLYDMLELLVNFTIRDFSKRKYSIFFLVLFFPFIVAYMCIFMPLHSIEEIEVIEKKLEKLLAKYKKAKARGVKK